MAIEVARVSEEMSVEELLLDNQGYLASTVLAAWSELADTKTLQFIDPWGSAIFNQAQIPVLLAEIEEYNSSSAPSEVREHLNKVLKLVASASDTIHTYIQFIGD